MNFIIVRNNFTKTLFRTIIAVTIFYASLPMRFAVYYNYIPSQEIRSYLAASSEPNSRSCPVLPDLNTQIGSFSRNYNVDHIKYAEHLNIQRGGFWKPRTCDYVHNVAIIVPFRERRKQLDTFLYHIHSFLQKQLISYRIFVVEQTFLKAFNRGLLLNAGFLEALKIHHFPCFIFHDVDLLPLVESNIYACTYKPRHLSSAINTWRYNLKYETAFGGVIAILQEHFFQINGFSNNYFGWGGEDDDLMERILENKLGYFRFSPEISRYYMLHHKPEKKNPERMMYLTNAQRRYKIDGVNSVNYTILAFVERPLHTHILVDPI